MGFNSGFKGLTQDVIDHCKLTKEPMEVPTRRVYELHCKRSVQRSLAYPQFEAELCGYVVYLPVSQSWGD